jgi:hypothetical protein
MKYNLLNAVAYEVTNILIDFNSKWKHNQWIKIIRDHCFHDWVEWRTERTMASVDAQVAELQKKMEEEDTKRFITPIIIEHEPDGSKAQQLLGGELQIKAPWVDSNHKD